MYKLMIKECVTNTTIMEGIFNSFEDLKNHLSDQYDIHLTGDPEQDGVGVLLKYNHILSWIDIK